jgi:hypothetical protein
MDGDFTSWREFTFWWAAALFASTVVVVARLGVMLFGKAVDPPEDPVMEKHWARRRRWIAIGEISALPAFATVSIVLVSYYGLDPVAGVLLAIAQGFIGFPLLLDGAAWVFRKRLGMPGEAPGASNGGGNA